MPRWMVIGTLAGSLVGGLGGSWLLLQAPPEAPAVVVASDATPPPDDAPLDAAPLVFDTSDWGPLPLPSGYSGTADVRTGVDAAADTSTASRALPRWAEGASEGQLPDVARALAKAHDYGIALHRLYQLGDKPVREDDVLVTRFQREPARMAGLLEQALAEASGVARQNIIFHMALALPDEIAFERLRAIARDGDRADAADVLHAMAFRGEPAALATFEALAARSDEADCHILCDGGHDELTRAGKRDVLRSYRCIELLDCRPYFHLHAWKYRRGLAATFPWADRKAAETVQQRRELAKRILPCWLARYPGHPGGDDMAWRLSRACADDEQWLEAARWASRCATWPDQDMTAHGVAMLVALAERVLEPWQIEALHEGDDYGRNRTLLQYIRLRRAAVEQSFEHALREAASIAALERDGLIAACFNARLAAEPPRGLTSGIEPLMQSDYLFTITGKLPESQAGMNPVNHWVNWRNMTRVGATPDERRLNPPQEAVLLPSDRLTRQFRMWDALAELERRRVAAAGDERADLSYKIAAVLYHERDAIYPVYATHRARSGLPDSLNSRIADYRRPGEVKPLSFASWRRSADLFEALADAHPDWPGRDKAIFSAGMSWIKLVDYLPLPAGDEGIRRGVKMFERLGREHPDSKLAGDAARAADYWRRVHVHAWKDDS
jgi:hypothetical protein